MTHLETNIEQDRRSKRGILTEMESAEMERLLFLKVRQYKNFTVYNLEPALVLQRTGQSL